MRATICSAVELLAGAWKISESDFAAPKEMRIGNGCPMSLVPLPASVRGVATRSGTNTDKEAFQLQEWLHHEHKIEVPVKCQGGQLYVRISAHVYNTKDDYHNLAKALLLP